MSTPLKPRMRWLVCLTLFALSHVANAEFLSTTLVRNQDSLALNGIGTVRQLNLNYYYAVLYIDQTNNQSEFVLDARRKRVLHLRVTADRLFASSAARHFREMIHLNNNRADIEKEFENLTRFYQIFRHGLARGDEIIFDASDARSTRISVNGSEQLRVNSPLFFNLLLRGYVGAQPSSQQLKNDILNLNTGVITQQLSEINALVASESRINLYKDSVASASSKSAPTPAIATPTTNTNTNTASVSNPMPTTANNNASSPVSTSVSATKPVLWDTETNLPAGADNRTKQLSPKAINDAKPADAKTTDLPIAAMTPSKTDPAANNSSPAKPLIEAAKATVAIPKGISDTEAAELLAAYQTRLQELLQKHLEYPKRELKQKYGLTQLARVKGNIILNINLDRSGEINAISFVQKSPDAILDEAAMNLIEKRSPFAPLSDQLTESSYEFFVELKFDPNQ